VITYVCRPRCLHFCRRIGRSFRTRPSQFHYHEGSREERDILHNKTIFLQSPELYRFEYSKPGYTFTGIACVPVNEDVQSPDAEVITGGINCSYVTICLKPRDEGEWACRVVVYGRLYATGPSADVSKQVHRFLCVTYCAPSVTILYTFVVEVSRAIYGELRSV
jgi:hypothetical protein